MNQSMLEAFLDNRSSENITIRIKAIVIFSDFSLQMS